MNDVPWIAVLTYHPLLFEQCNDFISCASGGSDLGLENRLHDLPGPSPWKLIDDPHLFGRLEMGHPAPGKGDDLLWGEAGALL